MAPTAAPLMDGPAGGDGLDFSICVPTHNRAGLLAGLFASVGAERGARYELIVVDDGSSDDTAATLAALAAAADFPVQALSQPAGGRGSALNRAFDAARGRFIFILDDDDTLVPGALAAVLAVWDAIPAAERDRFCGVCGLCVDPDGRVIGDRFPRGEEDSDFFAMRIVRGVRGDKREVVLRSAVADFRFPLVPGERRTSTNFLWFHLAARYRARFVNRALAVKTRRADGISASGLRQRVASPRLTRDYYRTTLALFPAMPLRVRLALATSYFRFARHAGDGAAASLKALPGGGLACLMLPLGRAVAALDRRKLART
jgi:glycosyltransferase involved in cell wall biosynthesis